ncbi:MAG TPA: sigma-70 family RNA polymerase sigma factor [Tepidisphaeraceae bacterium]|nr:sigma-70 family RNA polymerase sigma factor [Tepidisphaeraceae bacterium]
MCDSDDKLVAAMTRGMAAGEERAVEMFYRRYFDLLYAAARRATGRDEAFCLDVVQDAVLRVIRTIRPVGHEAVLVAWLRLVVRTTAYDLLRRERRQGRRDAAAHAGKDQGADESEREAAERLEWLRREIVQLDPQIVRAIELRYHDGWTLARVAGALGISVGSLDGKMRRALRRLRSLAPEEWKPTSNE